MMLRKRCLSPFSVSITRCRSAHDFKSVKHAVADSLKLLGGLEKIVRRGARVVVKPNLVVPAGYRTGAVTNPHVVRALCELAFEAGAGNVSIVEGSAVGEDTAVAFEKSGLKEVAGRLNIELIDVKKAKSVRKKIPGGLVYESIRIPEAVARADAVINVPVIKTHDAFPATLGLKNIKGFIPEADKKKFHMKGLAQCIVDLNKLVRPALTVVDGTVGMEGLGPVHGTPVNLGLIISSFHALSADVVASHVMGIAPGEIKYLRLAAEQGMGDIDLSGIEIVGLRVKEVRRSFKRITLDSREFKEKGVRVYEGTGCSGCKHVIEQVVVELDRDDKLDLIRPHVFVFGKNADFPEKRGGKFIKFGNCAASHKGGTALPRCPPHPHDVRVFLERL